MDPSNDPNSDTTVRGEPRRPRRRLGVWAIPAGVLGLAVGIIVYGVVRTPPAPPPRPKKLAAVEVATVRPRPYREALILPARVEADRVGEVSPEFSGKLARWRVAEGELVRRGDVVAEFDTASLRASLDELAARRRSAELSRDRARLGLDAAEVGLANARKDVQVRELALRSAEATLDLARTDHGRASRLVEEKVLDQARLDAARNTLTQAEVGVGQAREAVESAGLAVKGAEVRVEEAKAALAQGGAAIAEIDASVESLQVQIEKSLLRAPVAGYLEQHLAEPGEVVDRGEVVARLYDLGHLKAVVQVPDRYVPFLAPDNPAAAEYIRLNRPDARQEVRASLVLPGLPKLTGGETQGLEFPAEIARVSQAADPQSNTFVVELRLPNPSGALRHGVIARAVLEYLFYPAAIVVPVRAVQVTDAGPRVLVAETRDGHTFASVRDIQPASVRDDEVLLLSGLSGGERLIVAGWKGLVDGEEVSVVVADGEVLGVGDGGPTP